jgi:ATP-binding cassette subfamily F protein 3
MFFGCLCLIIETLFFNCKNQTMNKNNNFKIPKFFYENSLEKIQNPMLVLRNISKSYRAEGLFSDVNLTINSNDRIAIVGANGIGKSALLKIIIGAEEEDEGSITKNKNLKIGYLPQETHWKSLDNTLLQEIYSVDAKEINMDSHRYEGLVENLLQSFGFSEESWQRKIKTLSGGERTKLALAKILTLKPNLLILDEPTNHLDLRAIEWLEQFLINWNKTILCVSHDRLFLDKIFDKTFELTNQGLEKYYCRYSEYIKEKEKRVGIQEKNYKNQQKYFKEKQEFIDRFRYKATKAKGVQSVIKQIEKIEKLEKPKTKSDIKIAFDDIDKTCTRVLGINDLIVGDEQAPLFEIQNKIEVNWGDKIGIIGDNGTGKSSLLKAIINKNNQVFGKIKIGQGIKIGYYAQAHEELDYEKTILEEVASKTIPDEEKIRNVLGCLLFSQDKINKKIDQLSGGERARVALAELILQKSNLLVLDEPTNHLDLMSKEVVTNMLKEHNGTILLVSHDRYLLDKVCDNIWEIKNKNLKHYLGGYNDYLYSNQN